MHDVLEGVIPLILRLLIQSFHVRGIVSISQFNQLLECFDFGQNDISSKPVKVPVSLGRNDTSLPCEASEKWCLFRILPFIIGSFVDHDDEVWQVYLRAREVVELLLATVVCPTVLGYLQLLIASFLSEFSAVFPGKITPKMHFLGHYPRLIAEFGPLRSLWCMRFEAKHLYFKRLASGLSNFRNVSLSFASRHQKKQCWEFASVDLLHTDEETEGNSEVPMRTLTLTIREAVANYLGDDELIEAEEQIQKVKILRFDSIT